MMIVYGSKLYGKVDVVPGLFHVETRFGHLYYIPLIPIESFVVLGKSGDGFNGVKIPVSFKSVCYAWLRTATLLAAVSSLITVIMMWNIEPSACITAAIIGLSALATCAVLSFHKGSTQASYQRAYQIGQQIGMAPEGLLLIEQIYAKSEADPEKMVDPFASETAERFNADL